MKHHYLKLALALPLLLGAYLDSGAQIVLHDATDVTQTKATISADFPDGTTGHGFQYKYGTLPEIDDFSRCALAPNSDPVQVNSPGSYTYPWISNSSQQEIVSNGDLPIGEESKMSISAEFYIDTEISFEWAVDSEEEIGILYFLIDNNIIDAISGYKDYVKLSTIVTAGQHTLTWAYNKKEISNFGLDIGKVRNICVYNTIAGEWNYVNGNESVITELLPGSNVLYYATAANAQRSEIKQFKTLPVKFSDQIVHDITQTSAILDLNLSYGDAVGDFYVQLVDSCDISSIDVAKCVLSPQTFGSDIVFNGTEDLNPLNKVLDLSGEQCEKFSINFELKNPATLTFDVKSNNTPNSRYYYPRMYLDGIRTDITETSNYLRYSFELKAGEHVLKFGCHYKNSIQIKNFDIDNVERRDQRIDATLSDNIIINLDELKPNSTYFVRPVFSIIDKNWAEYDSGIKFSTKEIEFNINEDYNLTQTTAKINFDVNGGNSVITKVNFNYRPSNSDRWSSSEVIETDGHYIQILNRLKTDTSYEFRICAITDRNDSIFSPTKIFKTLPITISQLEAISLTQSKAVIKIPYQIGDAPILKSWYEFSVLNGSLIEKKEFELNQNSDSILVVFEDLRYNTSYTVNVHIEPVGAKIIDYPGLWFKTKDIAVLPPTIKKVSMHEAVITGHAITGDAKIDRKGISVGGIGIKYTTEEDSIFDISFKDLKPNTYYEVATVVNGRCSDWVSFKTVGDYFEGATTAESTQTTATFHATITDTDEDISPSYGFEYFIYSNEYEQFDNPEIISVPGKIEGHNLTTTVYGLPPFNHIKWRAYAIINDQKTYYTGATADWKTIQTLSAYLEVKALALSQTSIKLNVRPIPFTDSESIIENLEYSLDLSQSFKSFENNLILNDLVPDKNYTVYFRGTINGKTFSFNVNNTNQTSYFFKTLPLSVSARFSDITQTHATMTVNTDFGDVEVTDLQYCLYGADDQYHNFSGAPLTFTGLKPSTKYSVAFRGIYNGQYIYWSNEPTYTFSTLSINAYITLTDVYHTAVAFRSSYKMGDARFTEDSYQYTPGDQYVWADIKPVEIDGVMMFTGLAPGTTYRFRYIVKDNTATTATSSIKSATTKAINCSTDAATNLSNRSAKLNGNIDCDSYSSTEFGFQWKQMTGWNADPAFTKGKKQDDGEISVALVNGMLEPNTDYQYRSAVRYQDKIYAGSEWRTFRTESEFVYYPASVYTVFRTDRENNALVMCGYYIAGSETVVSQGYEYWKVGARTIDAMHAPAQTVTVTTDESMAHTFNPGDLAKGDYAIRAFVKTESGDVLYGATLGFTASPDGYAGIEGITSDDTEIVTEGTTVKIINGQALDCHIYNISGMLIAERLDMSDYEQFRLQGNAIYIVRLSNGKVMKVRL